MARSILRETRKAALYRMSLFLPSSFVVPPSKFPLPTSNFRPTSYDLERPSFSFQLPSYRQVGSWKNLSFQVPT